MLTGTLAGCLLRRMADRLGLDADGEPQPLAERRRHHVFTGCSLLILSAWYVDVTVLAVGLLAVGVFFAAVAGPLAYSASIDVGGPHVPQVFGLMNMCGNLGAAACPILVAKLFSWTANWGLVLLVFAGSIWQPPSAGPSSIAAAA